jgi:hypothetical protein
VKTPEENAVEIGVTQAQKWVAAHYGDDLNGKQVRGVVTGVAEILIPLLKVADYNELADLMDETARAAAPAMKPDDAEVFAFVAGQLSAQVRDSASRYLEEVRDGR